MKRIYSSRTRPSPAEEQELGASWYPLEELLREADFVTLHVPLTPHTLHLIGSRELELMKPSAYLINTARGPVVDEAALVTALRQGQITGPAWMSMRESRNSARVLPTSRTWCSCPTWGVPPLKPAPAWP